MWNKLKGAIFEEDPSEVKTAAPAANNQPAAASATNNQPLPTGTFVAPNNQFVDIIKKAVFAKQTALTTLLEAADKLANIIPDANTRYRAAHATAGHGRTAQQIAAAADIHLQDVDGEEMRFKAATESALGSEIASLEAQANAAANQVKATQAQIEQLQQQILAAQQRVGELTQQQAQATAAANGKRVELETVAMQFKAAATTVRNDINNLRATVLASLS